MKAKESTILLLTIIFCFFDGDFRALGAATRFFSKASPEAKSLAPSINELPFLEFTGGVSSSSLSSSSSPEELTESDKDESDELDEASFVRTGFSAAALGMQGLIAAAVLVNPNAGRS
jgi:hypothetical protein